MTRRARVLDELEPAPWVAINPRDALTHGIKEGDTVTLESRRGEISITAKISDSSPVGPAYLPFCYIEAAANVLTNTALDPQAKIAEVKYCAVRLCP